MDTLFGGQEKIQVRAMFIAERLDLRDFEKAQCLATKPLLLTAGGSGCAALFRYGAVVLFGLNAIEETTWKASRALSAIPLSASMPKR